MNDKEAFLLARENRRNGNELNSAYCMWFCEGDVKFYIVDVESINDTFFARCNFFNQDNQIFLKENSVYVYNKHGDKIFQMYRLIDWQEGW